MAHSYSFVKFVAEVTRIDRAHTRTLLSYMPEHEREDLLISALSLVSADVNANDGFEIQFIANCGHKIASIKQYRGITGEGLKEAKDIIEASEFNWQPAPQKFTNLEMAKEYAAKFNRFSDIGFGTNSRPSKLFDVRIMSGNQQVWSN